MKKKIKLTPSLARIVAHICADGYIRRYKQKRSKKELKNHPRTNIYKNRWKIVYVNTNNVLVKQFYKDAKETLDRKPVARFKKNSYEICNKWVYELVTSLGAGKSREWFIAMEIMNSTKEIKSAWLQAFFDDEAYVDKKKRRIVLNIVNLEGLKQIQKLLEEFRIESKIGGPYFYKKYFSYHLKIYHDNLQKYQEKIGFFHPKKKKDLRNILKNGDARI